MTDTLFALVSTYGVGVIGLSAYLSCLLVPIPTSLLMLAGGAFVASGDLVAWHVLAAALAGAVLGDQTGFYIGRRGGRLFRRLTQDAPKRAAIFARAQAFVDRHGGLGVFFSTWAVAPLGPYVNFVAGATGLGRLRFTFWDMAGEMIWTTGYLSLGYLFASQIGEIATMLSNATGFLVALVATAGLALAMRDALRRGRAGTTGRGRAPR